MKNYTLNIGLENNPATWVQIERYFSNNPDYRNINSRVNVGEWDGKPERTLILQFETNLKISEVIAVVERLTKKLTQDAIPVQGENFGILIYNENFEGEKYSFDPQYFINF